MAVILLTLVSLQLVGNRLSCCWCCSAVSRRCPTATTEKLQIWSSDVFPALCEQCQTDWQTGLAAWGGWYRQVTITEREGGVEAKWPNSAEGETVAAFLRLFWMSDPPKRKVYFSLMVCFIDEGLGEYTGMEVWQTLHRGGESIVVWGV